MLTEALLIFEALWARVTSESHKNEENEPPDPPKPHEGLWWNGEGVQNRCLWKRAWLVKLVTMTQSHDCRISDAHVEHTFTLSLFLTTTFCHFFLPPFPFPLFNSHGKPEENLQWSCQWWWGCLCCIQAPKDKKVLFTDGLHINWLMECGCFDSDLDEAEHTPDNKAACKRRGKGKQ